jgi:hypothetical protein
MRSIFDFLKTKMEMLQVFIKTEEDEKEDVAAQYTRISNCEVMFPV